MGTRRLFSKGFGATGFSLRRRRKGRLVCGFAASRVVVSVVAGVGGVVGVAGVVSLPGWRTGVWGLGAVGEGVVGEGVVACVGAAEAAL